MVTCAIKSRASKSDIEQLAEGLERCRKAMLLSKVAVTAGGICILAYFLGPIRFDPTILIGALAAIIGGVVVFGSNFEHIEADLGSDERCRGTKSRVDRHDRSALGGFAEWSSSY